MKKILFAFVLTLGIGVSAQSFGLRAGYTMSGLTIDDIGDGSVNRYYGNSLVLNYLNTLGVISGSGGGSGFSVSGTNNYETQITDDDDVPNKKYVDDAITTGIQTITIQSTLYIPLPSPI